MKKLNNFGVMAYDQHRKMDKHYCFGLVVTDKQIDIFFIDQTSFHYFTENTPDVCQKILTEYFLGEKIQNMQWTYTAGGGHSKIIFNEQNNLITTMTFTNGAVLQPYCYAYTMEKYEAALDDPRGLELALLDGYETEAFKSSFFRDSITRYLVHTPYHDKYKIHVMKPPYSHDPEQYPIILVDTEKFISYWKQQSVPIASKDTVIDKLKSIFGLNQGNCEDRFDGADCRLLSSTLETSLKYYIPDEMACGVSLSFDNIISFANGRHRTVNLANLGAPFIPVQSSSYEEEKFRTLFEW